MKNQAPSPFPALAALVFFAAACASDADEGEPMGDVVEESAPATVTITSPAEGDTVDPGPLTVTMTVTGVSIVPAGDTTSGTGHHHLYLDADVDDVTVPVPTVPGSIVHMGDASSQFTFEEVGPGEHRLIAIVADGVHVPLRPLVVDTVHFVVTNAVDVQIAPFGVDSVVR